MQFLRWLLRRTDGSTDPTYNPRRTSELYAKTPEGYIIAQDIACQYEYAREQPCPHCGGRLNVVAQLNRASQGLNELVCLCHGCHRRTSFIFDISNEVYQKWLARNLGENYTQSYDGPPRKAAQP